MVYKLLIGCVGVALYLSTQFVYALGDDQDRYAQIDMNSVTLTTYQTMNQCIVKKFCNRQVSGCKKQCRVIWNKTFLNCINTYPKYKNYTNYPDDKVKTAWQLKCQIKKLKTIMSQIKYLKFNSPKRKMQKQILMKSLINEIDQRFRNFYKKQ